MPEDLNPQRASDDHHPEAEELERAFALFENLPVAAGVFRAVRDHGNVVDVVALHKNREFAATPGFDGDVGRRHFERFPDAQATATARRFLDAIQRVLASGRSETVETYAPSPAQSFLFDVVSVGAAEHFLILLRRIPDNMDSDRQIRRLLKEQEFLLEGQSIGYWKSVDHVFSWTNAAFDQMLGYERHELMGHSSRVIYPAAEPFEAIGERLSDPDQARAGIRFDTHFVRKNGRLGWFEVVLQQISEDGQLTLIGSCIDRSSEQSALLALKKSEQRLMTCLKGSGAAYFDWDLTTGEVEFDRGLKAILGAMPGKSFDALQSMVNRGDRETLQRYLDGQMNNDVVSDGCEFRIHHRDGRWIWVLLRSSIVEFESEERRRPSRVAGTITDITATKRIERETEQLLHRLEHLIKERLSPHDHFANGASAASKASTLSRRQVEVLRLIASGNTTAEIALRLHISEATVQSHRKEIMQKLGQKNIATLTRFAIEAGLL